MRIKGIYFSCLLMALASKTTDDSNDISESVVSVQGELLSTSVPNGKFTGVECNLQMGLEDVTGTFTPFYNESNITHQKYFGQRTDTEKKIITSLTSSKQIDKDYEKIGRLIPEYSIRDVVELSFETAKSTPLIMDVAYGYGWCDDTISCQLLLPGFGFGQVPACSYKEHIDPSIWVNLVLDLLINCVTEGITDVKYRASATEAIQGYFENPKPYGGSNNSKSMNLSLTKHAPHDSLMKALPRPIMAKIALHAIPEEFTNKQLFKEIVYAIETCIKSANNQIERFVKCICLKGEWAYWSSEKVYGMVHKFAYNHSMTDKEATPWIISSMNVVSIVDAMFIALAHGRRLTSVGFPVKHIQNMCIRITDVQRRLLSQNLSRASLKRQLNECKTKTDSEDIFNLVYDRTIMLLTFTRLHASRAVTKVKPGYLYLGRADPNQYIEQVSGWISYFMKD